MSADNIKVAIKARPLLKKENDNKQACQWKIVGNSIHQIDSQSEPFYFDHIFDRDATNQELFEMVAKPIVDATLKGFNGTIFAYGQTSSGKTYTMLGEDGNPGVVDLAAKEIFKEIEAFSERVFLLRVGYIEIYNEKIYDLLNKDNRDLKIHEGPAGDTTVNCTEHIITSQTQIIEYLTLGNKSRKIGETLMNERSSRSHAIFRIIIESRERDQTADESAVQISNLNLVDLAGSERADQTGATGSRLKEGAHINKSLLYLSCVISKLSENESDKYINYRDSKLTRILQASLGGNALTAIICTIKPSAIEETNSTLSFAMRAKSIKNKPRVNEVVSEAAMMKRLEKEIARLEEELAEEKFKNSHIKIAALENKIRENELKIVIPTTSSSRLLVDKARRRTWCPTATNTSPIFPKPDIENNKKIANDNHLLPSSKAHMTPLITLRENYSDGASRDCQLECHFEESYKPAEDVSFFRSPNTSVVECKIKTPKVFRKTERDSMTPTIDKYEHLKQEYEELKDFTNLEKQIDVKHETLAVLKQKLLEAQEKSMQFELERSKFEAFQDDYLQIEKRYNDLLKNSEEFKKKESQFIQNEKQFKERCEEFQQKEDQFKQSQDQFKQNEEEYKSRIDEALKEISKLKLDYQKLESIEYEKEQHQKIAKLRQDDLLSIITERETKIESLEKHIEQILETSKNSAGQHSENMRLNNEIQELNKQNVILKGICEKSNEVEVQLHELTKKYEKLLECEKQIQNENLELSNQLMEAIQESESYQARCNEYETNIQSAKEKCMDLEKDLLLKQERISSLEILQIMHTQEMDQLQEQKSFIIKMQEENSNKSNQIKELQTLCDEFRSKLEDYETQVEKYMKDLENLKIDCSNLDIDIVSKQEKISSLESEIDSAAAKFEKSYELLLSEKNVMSLANDEKENLIKVLREDMKKQEDELILLKKSQNELNAQILRLDENLLNNKNEMLQLQTSNSIWQNENEKVKSELGIHMEKIHQLTDENLNLTKNLQKLEEEKLPMSSDNYDSKHLQENIKRLEQEIDVINKEKLSIDLELEKSQVLVGNLNQQQEKLIFKNDELNLENIEFKKEIVDLNTQIKTREEQLKANNDTNKKLQEDLSESWKKLYILEQFKEQNDTLNAELIEIKTLIRQFEAENLNLEKLKLNNEMLNNELLETKTRLDQIENENSNLVQNLCSKIVILETEICRLQCISEQEQLRQTEFEQIDLKKIKAEKEDSFNNSRSKSVSQDSLEEMVDIKPNIEKLDKTNELSMLIAESLGSELTFLKNTIEYLIENQYEQSGKIQNVDKCLSSIEVDHEKLNRLKEENSSLKCKLQNCLENVIEKQPIFINEVENIQKQNNDLMKKLVQLEEDLTGKDKTKILIEEQNKVLMMEIDNLKNLNNDLIMKLEKNKIEICSSYENRMENYKTELNELKEMKESLQKELDILKEDYNRKKDENTVLIEEQNGILKKEMEHLKLENNELVQKLKNKSEEIVSLECHNQCIQDDLIMKLETNKIEICSSYENRMENYKTELNELKEMKESLQKELDILKEDYNRKKDENTVLIEEQNGILKKEMEHLKLENNELVQKLKNKSEEIVSLESHNQCIQDKLKANETDIETMKQNVEDKSSIVALLKKELSEFENKLTINNSDIEHLKSEINEKNNNLRLTKDQLNEENVRLNLLQDQLENIQKQYNSLEESSSQLLVEKTQKDNENRVLRESLSAKEEIYLNVCTELHEIKSNLEKSNQHNKELLENIAAGENLLSTKNEILERIKEEKTNLEMQFGKNLKQAEDECKHLKNSLSELKEMVTTLEIERNNLQKDKISLELDLSRIDLKSEEQLLLLKAELKDVQLENSILVIKLDKAESLKKEVEDSLKTAISDGRQQEEKIKNIENDIVCYKKEIEKLTVEKAELIELQDRLEKEKLTLEESLTRLTADIQKEKEIAEKEIQRLQAIIIDDVTTISDLKCANEQLSDNHNKLKVEIEELTNKFHESNKNFVRLEAELKESKLNAENLKAENTNCHKEVNENYVRLEAELKESKLNAEKLKAENTNCQKEVNANYVRLETELKESKLNAENLKAVIANCQKEVNEYNAKYTLLKNIHDKLTADIKLLEIRENDKDEVLKQLEQHISSVVKEKATLQDKYQFTQKEYQCNIEQLQQKIKDLSSINENFSKKNIEFAKENQSITFELRELQTKFTVLQNSSDSLICEKNKLDEDIRAKSSDYMQIKFEFTSLQKRFDSLTNEYESLKDEFSILGSKDSQREEKMLKLIENQTLLSQNAKEKTQKYEKLHEESNILVKQYQDLKSGNEKLIKSKSNLDEEINLKCKEIFELKEKCNKLEAQIVDIRSKTRSESSFIEKESKIQELETNLETALIERNDFIKRQEIVNVLIGENNQLKAKNQNLVFELDEARKTSQKDRKNRRQSSHDEKRSFLWDNTRDVSTMTVPTDKSCNCEQLNEMVIELKRSLRIKECQIKTMILESKANPLKDDNEMLKKLLSEEENSTKKLRVEITKLTKCLAENNNKSAECMECLRRLGTIKKEQCSQTDNNTNPQVYPESYGSGIVSHVEFERLQNDHKKLEKRYEDLKVICRQRLARITKLELQLTQEKENESGNSQDTRLGSILQRTRSAAEITQIDSLKKQVEEYHEKYNSLKKLYLTDKNGKAQQDIKSECNSRAIAVQTDVDHIVVELEVLQKDHNKLEKKYEDIKTICRHRHARIQSLEKQLEKEKENESGNSKTTEIDLSKKLDEKYNELKKMYHAVKIAKEQQDLKPESNCRVLGDRDPIFAQYENLKAECKQLQLRLEEGRQISGSSKNQLKQHSRKF